MIMLLNPGTKKRKRRKYSGRARRRYGSRRRVSSRRRRMSAKARRRASRRSRAARRFKVLKGFVCSPSRARLQREKDVSRYCRSKRKSKASKGWLAPVASSVAGTSSIPILSGTGFNPGRRRKGRNYSHWIPAYRNPSLTASLAAPFNTRLLMSTIPFVGGFMLNGFTSGLLASPGFVPAFLKSGWGSYITGLISAGVTASVVGVVSPASAGGALLGSVSQVAVRIFRDQVLPMFPGVAMALTGLQDFLTVGDARRARKLHGMDDFLTVGDARRARRLHGMEGHDYTSTSGMFGDDDDGMSALPFNVDLGARPFGETEERPFGDNMGAAPVCVSDSPYGDEVDSEVLAYEG